MALTDGERKARVLACRQWRERLNKLHGDSWAVAGEARTANVIESARILTALTIILRELVDELERDSGSPVAYREVSGVSV